LNRLEAEANEVFAKSEEARVIIRQRAIEIWALLRPELHAGSIACIILKEGEMVSVSPSLWATNNAKALFRECTYDGSEIFVSDIAVSLSLSGSEAGAETKPKGDVSSPPPRFSPAAAEVAYKKRVEGWPQDEPPPSRDEDAAWFKAEFGTSRTFARDMRNKHAPEEWRSHGRRKTGGN